MDNSEKPKCPTIEQLQIENKRLHREKLFWVNAGYYEVYVQEKYELEKQIEQLQAKIKAKEDAD
jgi:hypothetical protein